MNTLYWIVGACVAGGVLSVALAAVFALAFFVSELAVTESLRLQATFYAAGAR